MAKLEVLEVKFREETGKRRNRRLRAAGCVPATLYGHKKAPQTLCVPEDQLNAVLRHGGHVVELQGDVAERAQLKEVQWDVWGQQVLHVDLTRVEAHEKVQLTLLLHLRGEAEGVKQGGVVEQLVHEIELECEATSVPETVEIRIAELEMGMSLTVADIELPEGVKVLLPADTPVVQCVEKREMPEEETAAEGEPEVIAKKKAEEA